MSLTLLRKVYAWSARKLRVDLVVEHSHAGFARKLRVDLQIEEPCYLTFPAGRFLSRSGPRTRPTNSVRVYSRILSRQNNPFLGLLANFGWQLFFWMAFDWRVLPFRAAIYYAKPLDSPSSLRWAFPIPEPFRHAGGDCLAPLVTRSCQLVAIAKANEPLLCGYTRELGISQGRRYKCNTWEHPGDNSSNLIFKLTYVPKAYQYRLLNLCH